MSKKNELVKRGYRIPEKLAVKWEEFHSPSKEFSTSVAGAFLVWMALPAELREQAKKLSFEEDLKISISKMKNMISYFTAKDEMQDSLDGFLEKWNNICKVNQAKRQKNPSENDAQLFAGEIAISTFVQFLKEMQKFPDLEELK